MNKIVASSPTLSAGIIGRFIPLISVAGANLVNIPLMRQVELKEGITVTTDQGVEIGKSQKAAVSALQQVLFAVLYLMYLSHCSKPGHSFESSHGCPVHGANTNRHEFFRKGWFTHQIPVPNSADNYSCYRIRLGIFYSDVLCTFSTTSCY